MPDVFPGLPFSPVQPGAYSVIDTTQISSAQRGLQRKVVAIVGAAAGGPPNTPLFVYGQAALKQLLKSGACYDLARLAFLGGSQPVCVVRAGAGILRSSGDVASAGGTALTLTSLDYGAWTTSIKYTVTAGSVLTITYLDSATGVTYKETYTPTATTTGIPADLVAQIAGLVPGVPKSSFVSGVVGAFPNTLSNVSATALASGSDGTVSGGDWTTALVGLEPTDVSIVVPASPDASVHAQVITHCVNMSDPAARKERTARFGGEVAESVSQAVARALTVGVANRRGQLVYPGVTMFNDAGAVTALKPMHAAAYIAGRACAQPDEATSLTHQILPDVLDVEKALSTVQGGDIDTLLRAGVAAIAPADGGGIWLTDDLSLEPTNPVFRDVIKVRSLDEVSRRLRERINREWVGQKGLNATAGSIAKTVAAELGYMKGAGLIRDFVESEVTVQQSPTQANTYSVTAPVQPVDTVKFVPITVAVQAAATVAATAN